MLTLQFIWDTLKALRDFVFSLPSLINALFNASIEAIKKARNDIIDLFYPAIIFVVNFPKLIKAKFDEFYQYQIWPIIGNIKKELTSILNKVEYVKSSIIQDIKDRLYLQYKAIQKEYRTYIDKIQSNNLSIFSLLTSSIHANSGKIQTILSFIKAVEYINDNITKKRLIYITTSLYDELVSLSVDPKLYIKTVVKDIIYDVVYDLLLFLMGVENEQ